MMNTSMPQMQGLGGRGFGMNGAGGYGGSPTSYGRGNYFPGAFAGGYPSQLGGPFTRGRGRGAFPRGPYVRGRGYMRGSPEREEDDKRHRQWEKMVLCCYFIQGACKFEDGCKYSHEDDGKQDCHFGLSCKHGHYKRKDGETAKDVSSGGATAEPSAPPQ